MSESLEGAIRDLLISEGSSERVAQILLQRLTDKAPNSTERKVFVNYLIHAGLYREVLSLYEKWLLDEKNVDLIPLCYVLHKSGFKPGAEFLKSLFSAITHSESEITFTHFLPWESIDAKFIDYKNISINWHRQQAIEHKKSKYDKLDYYRANRMIEEEEKLLNELHNIYPEDENLQDDKRNFKVRWARAIIAKKSFAAFDESAESTEPTFSREELKITEAILSEMKKRVKKNSQLAYNFSIALYFLELFEQAREILKSAPSTLAVDWLFIEILIKCRRHVECLDAIASIEIKYANDPETTFGATYYRALALSGLGQMNSALELMKSIVSIRPNYRTAHSLVMKWGGNT